MSALLPNVDPDGLLEFSVVYTDRSLNHMSKQFQGVMHDMNEMLTSVYNADACAIIPGGGTYAMEAVARQFATDQKAIILRNGWFSFRWTQIFEAADIPADDIVMKARRTGNAHQTPFAPAPIDEVVAKIKAETPDVVFAPHVETSSGMILPDDYLKAVADAVHSVGGIFVLDCIASGCIWVDMKATGVDVLISAPQKGWSASPCAGLVMMNEDAKVRMANTSGTSFSVNLLTWSNIMDAFLNGGHAYHATMPTDALKDFRDTMIETREHGFDKLKAAQQELGAKVRAVLAKRGFPSVAESGFGAPGVVVSYTDDAGLQNGSKFSAEGVQIAAGVPLRCDEPSDYSTFRLGLFGLDKLYDVDATVARLEAVLDKVS
jgi:aspartate aminotransferase-like enzyme